MTAELPLPPFHDPSAMAALRPVPYGERARAARAWARTHRIAPVSRGFGDDGGAKVCLVLVDMQVTFCHPEYPLFVAGRSGSGAVDDARRVTELIYRHLGRIDRIVASLDTHRTYHVFHPDFLLGEDDEPLPPFTVVTAEDVRGGRVRFDPSVAPGLGITADEGQRHLEHYTAALERRGRYDLMVWPYHAMLGGLGHALLPAVQEAVFFHQIARRAQADLVLKGLEPLTEHYSAMGPEVDTDARGRALEGGRLDLLQIVRDHDVVLVAGQAQSHCVAWTLADLADAIRATDAALARRVVLLDDCTSAVVIPGGEDFTDRAEEAFSRLAAAGMRRARSTDPAAALFG